MAKSIPIYKLTHPNRPLRESASVLLVRLQEMMEWSAAAHDPECVEELHNMRIAAKRLRYTLEVFAPTLGPDAEPVLQTVEEMQEQLGAIHDCDVLIPTIAATMEREIEREQKMARRGESLPEYLAATGLSQLLNQKRQERERRWRDFIAWWDNLPPERFAESLRQLGKMASSPISPVVRVNSSGEITDAL